MPRADLTRKHNKGARYTEAEIEQGLHMLALRSGNSRAAAKELAKGGVKVSYSTLYRWQQDQPERYQRIEEEVIPELYAGLARSNEAVAQQATDLEVKLLGKIDQATDAGELTAKDQAGALRNVSVTKGVAMDKATIARGRPTEIKATADVTQLIESMARRFPGVIQHEGEAEEITGAE